MQNKQYGLYGRNEQSSYLTKNELEKLYPSSQIQQQQQFPTRNTIGSVITQKPNDDYNKYNDYSKTYAKPTKGIVGLKNIGNTCFMNSVLQCLLNLPNFNEALLQEEKKSYGRSVNQIGQEYAKLVNTIRSLSNFSSEAPYSLKSAVEYVQPSFRGYAQQDAQEFMVTLLDGISLSLNRVKTKPIYREMNDNLKGRTLQDLSQEWFDYSKSREDSVVLDYFQGQFLNMITSSCCKSDSYAFDNFLDISVAITRGLGMLEDFEIGRLLDKYEEEEYINESICNKCKRVSKAKKKLVIWRLPKILVIHIKRFNFRKFGSDKLNHRVSFPENLDMSQFTKLSSNYQQKFFIILIADSSTKSSQYKLCGIVNHSGSLNGGHYTADCRNPFDQKWYRFNDSYVSEINLRDQNYSTLGSSSPYIIFYAQQ